MSIASQMTDFLNREGAATPEAIAASIPDLSQCGGAERALLLLRLNPQFERIDKEAFSLMDAPKVKQILMEQFITMNTNIFYRPNKGQPIHKKGK